MAASSRAGAGPWGRIGSVLILAVDTSTLAGSVAVLDDDRVAGLMATRSDETYSSRLFRHVRLLLDDLKLGLEQFDLFAVAAGPGSFTGLRVGLAAVKGWAEAYAKPVASVSALEAVAAEARAGERFLVPIIDARRGQIYAGLYERAGRGLERRSEEVVMAPEEFFGWLAREIPGQTLTFVTPTPEVISGPLGRSQLRGSAVEFVPSVLAPRIGWLGLARARSGELTDALRLDANYIRRSDAELLYLPVAGREEVKLRPLAPDDLDAVLEIQRASPDAARWRREDYAPVFAGEMEGWGAVGETGLAGFLVARRVADELEVMNLAVTPAARRAGTGSRLLARALETARRAGVARVFLEVRASNEIARRFYARHGFETVGRRPQYYSAPFEDALVLARRLR